MKLIVLFVAASVIGMAQPVKSQAVSLATDNKQSAKTFIENSRINIDLQDVTLRDAVRQVMSLSGINILYSPELLSQAVSVTYRASGVTAYEALREIFKGTGLYVSQSSFGGLKIERTGGQRLRGSGVIVGKVTDSKTGKGIPGANVAVDSDNRGVVTGEDGAYKLASIGAGIRTLTVRLVGYAKQTQSVTIGEGSTITVDFRLEPSASVLDQVVVTGTVIATELKAVPSAITIVTAKDIEERGITRIDQLFRGDVPGLFSANLGSGSLLDSVAMYSRGATQLTFGTQASAPIKTYVDGIELANPAYLSQIDPRSIERIEILTGPQASTVYGSNAINGVMQIFTKRGSTARPELTLNFSSGLVQNNYSPATTPMHMYDGRISGTEGRFGYNAGGSWDYMGAWTPAKQSQRISGYGSGRMQMQHGLTVDASMRSGLTKNRQRGNNNEATKDLEEKGIWLSSGFPGVSAPTTHTLASQTVGTTIGLIPLSWWSHEMVLGADISKTEVLVTSPRYVGTNDTLLNVNQNQNYRASQRYTTNARLPIMSIMQLTLTLGGDHWRARSLSTTARPTTLVGSLANTTMTRNPPSKNRGGFVQG